MSYLQELLGTYLFLTPLIVLVLSEITKFFSDRIKSGMWSRTLFQHGGFPSSHSAFVTSLLIVVGRKTGIESVEFAMTTVLACIVWYDAVAIRSTINGHAKALNFLQQMYQFSEEVGHSLAEVLAGIGFGAVITLVGIWIS